MQIEPDALFRAVEQRQLQGMDYEDFNDWDKMVRERPLGDEKPELIEEGLTQFHEMVKTD